MAVLELLGGFVLAAQLWPADRTPVFGVTAYMPALTCVAGGSIFATVFWAMGDGLRYLHDIRQLLLEGAARRRAN